MMMNPLPFRGDQSRQSEPLARWKLRLIAGIISCTVILTTAAFNLELLHWCLIPLLVCGTLIGADALRWFDKNTSIFDTEALIGIFGYNFFLIAPILMVTSGWHMKYLPDQPTDYRDYLGAMACFNAAGIFLYQSVRSWVIAKAARRVRAPKAAPARTLIPRRFWPSLVVLLLCGFLCQAYILHSFGGLAGYMDSYTSAIAGTDTFQGLSLLFSVAESIPILLAIAFAVWNHKKPVSLGTVMCVIFGLALLDFLTGGLRGSRSNVIWSLFWIAGVLHLYVRRLPRAMAYGGIVVLYLFVSVYAAYKEHGSHLLESFASSGEYSAINDDSEGPATVLVGDFSRADVQSYLFYKQWNDAGQQRAQGATYLGAITMVVPKTLWPGRPATILKWTTDTEYGSGTFAAGTMLSSRVYGIAGEAMINFGPFGILLGYVIFGLLVGLLQVASASLSKDDVRLMLLPFLTNLLLVVLLNDSDNVVFYTCKYGLVPVVLLMLSSRSRGLARMPVRRNSPPVPRRASFVEPASA